MKPRYSRVYGRCGWRATFEICQEESLAYTSLVSVWLFFCRRSISCDMSTAESSCTKRNSSIFASRSAMGCSKSRKLVFIKEPNGHKGEIIQYFADMLTHRFYGPCQVHHEKKYKQADAINLGRYNERPQYSLF